MDTSGATEMMAAPVMAENGTKSLPRRTGARTMIPSTWEGRSLKVEHLVGGVVRESSGTYLDWTPVGVILLVAGSRTLISWDTLCVCELQPD